MVFLIEIISIYLTGFFEKFISLWPVWVALVVLMLAFLWYYQIKSMRKRRSRPATGLINPIILLGIITLLILMLLALSYFFNKMEERMDKKEDSEFVIIPEKIKDITFGVDDIKGADCEELLNNVLKAHGGIKLAESSYKKNTARVLYDSTKVNYNQIIKIIEANGFDVLHYE